MNLTNKFINSDIRKRFFNAILFGIGGAVTSKVLLMLFNIIIARILGQTQYGIYSLINNTVQTFTVFAGAGLGVTLSRYVALYRDKDQELTGIVIKTLLMFNVILSAIISIIVFFLANNISNLISEEVNITIYIKITSGTIFFTSVASILQSILQGFEEYKKIAIVQIIANIVLLIVGVILTLLIKITGAIIALMMLQIISTILFIITILKITKQKQIKPKFKINQTVEEAIKKVAIPAFLSTIFVLPLLWITNFVFINKNGYEEFAAFSVCLQWFTILNYLPQQLGQVKPIYTQLFADGKIKEFKKTINKMILFSTMFAIIAATILMLGSFIILKAYGDFYTAYIIPFIIILVASIFYAVQSQYGSVFHAIGKVWMALFLNIIWAISFVICFIFLYSKGALGYCLTYLISYCVYSVVSVIVFNIVIKKAIKE